MDDRSRWLLTVRPFYEEPHRAYHTFAHLRRMLVLLRRAARARGYPEIPAPLFFAALFHDAVYDPTRTDNEERSAALCRHRLADARIPARVIDRAETLILATKTHVPFDRRFDMLALLDADLRVLGAEDDAYRRYAAQIRQEYAHVPIDAYRRGRIAVLNRFLARSSLFHSERPAVRRWEEQARRNLQAEIERLSLPTEP
ncbi:MAG: hypothetical protein SFU56_11680 [Capsulimonadales bacterium]|nr:hypothetical protein [Capsulimonadales bacterium]